MYETARDTSPDSESSSDWPPRRNVTDIIGDLTGKCKLTDVETVLLNKEVTGNKGQNSPWNTFKEIEEDLKWATIILTGLEKLHCCASTEDDCDKLKTYVKERIREMQESVDMPPQAKKHDEDMWSTYRRTPALGSSSAAEGVIHVHPRGGRMISGSTTPKDFTGVLAKRLRNLKRKARTISQHISVGFILHQNKGGGRIVWRHQRFFIQFQKKSMRSFG